MVDAVRNQVYGNVNVVTRRELMEDEKVFQDARKNQNKSGVRRADWGLYAAQNCLARDLVNANPEEVGLIMDKMNFIQEHMNKNLQLDSDIYVSRTKVNTDSLEAKTKMVKASGEVATGMVDSAKGLVTAVNPATVSRKIDVIA